MKEIKFGKFVEKNSIINKFNAQFDNIMQLNTGLEDMMMGGEVPETPMTPKEPAGIEHKAMSRIPSTD